MKLSRALLLLPLTALAACGSSVVPSSGQAHTIACRSYLLTVGNQDAEHTKELIAETPLSTDGIQSDTVLVKVRAAAQSSGSTAGLSEGDFQRFRKVVEALDNLADHAKPLADGTQEITATALKPVAEAAAAVHALCY